MDLHHSFQGKGGQGHQARGYRQHRGQLQKQRELTHRDSSNPLRYNVVRLGASRVSRPHRLAVRFSNSLCLDTRWRTSTIGYYLEH